MRRTTIEQAYPPLAFRLLNKCGGWFNGALIRPFDAEQAIETARKKSRLHDFGKGEYQEALSRLLESCQREANLNLIGRLALRSDVIRILINRLLMQRDRLAQSEIGAQEIRQPLFIVGLPRTGTTLLHSLLACDRAHRAPLTWEVMEPSPPSRNEKQERIERARDNLVWLQRLAPKFADVHSLGAELPQECVSLMSPSFLSDQFDTMYNIPSYRVWFFQQDLQPAYEFHRRFLQHLQQRKRAERWILKAPTHMFALSTLLAVYPDALFVQTHRAPLKAVTSVSSLVTILRRVFSDSVDTLQVGKDALQYWSETLHTFLREREKLPPERIFDLSYADLRRDPVNAARNVYRYFDWPFSSETERRMRKLLTKQSRNGSAHFYDPAQFRFRPEDETEFFGEYCERFDVRSNASARLSAVAT